MQRAAAALTGHNDFKQLSSAHATAADPLGTQSNIGEDSGLQRLLADAPPVILQKEDVRCEIAEEEKSMSHKARFGVESR
eukprot:5693649-Pleurochrysis_carterae.AAC.5